MAGKLVNLLSPLMDELSYIFGPFTDQITYNYTLQTDFAGFTEIDTFTISFLTRLKMKDRLTMKRKFLKHFSRPNSIIRSINFTDCTIQMKLRSKCEYKVVSDIIQEAKLENPFDEENIAKSSLKLPPPIPRTKKKVV